MEMRILAIDSSGISKGDSEEGWRTTATSASSKMVLSNKTSGWTVMYFSRAGARYMEKISSEAEIRIVEDGTLAKRWVAPEHVAMIFCTYSIKTFP